MGTGPAVTIVVPCRNESASIERCIQSILSQVAPPGGFEVIIADGLSDDGTRGLLERFANADARVRVIDNPGRIPATGLNAAIAVARGEVIVRMDAHTTYAPDYVSECLAVLAESGADNVGGPARTLSTGYIQEAICAAYHSGFSVGGARFHDIEYEGDVDTVTYGCWPIRVFDRVGLFDSELGRNEDDEFNLRLIRAGGRVYQSPRIRSWYSPRSSLSALFRQYMQYGFWKVRIIQKHRLPASPRHLVPAAFLLALIALPLISVVAPSAFYLWVLLMVAYAFCLTVASFAAAARARWQLLPVLPAVFACYHLSYGWGFARGLLDCAVLRRPASRRFSDVTRPLAPAQPLIERRTSDQAETKGSAN